MIVTTSFSTKVLLDTELNPRKKYGVDAVDNVMSPANLHGETWENLHEVANIFKHNQEKSVDNVMSPANLHEVGNVFKHDRRKTI